MEDIIIKKAVKADAEIILDLVKKLAIFELAPDEVSASVQDYIDNGFNEHPLFECNLIYYQNQLAGFSLWYFRFSTWKGKRFYLEDLYINEEFRGLGLGKLLLEECIQEAKRTNCKGMMWQVLEWNHPAIDFYKKYGVKLDEEWINVNLEL
jgi:GNAT superfamily N-acetyltransferase